MIAPAQNYSLNFVKTVDLLYSPRLPEHVGCIKICTEQLTLD